MLPLKRTKLLAVHWLNPDYPQVLLISPQGFFLAYEGYDLDIDALQVRLGPFDAEDWSTNIAQVHADEGGTLSEKCIRDARHLLEKVLPQDFCYAAARLLHAVQGNLALYNRLLCTDSEKMDLRLQALASVPVLRLILPGLDEASIQIRHCIDTRGNLWDAIFALFPGRKATLKHLSKDAHCFEFWRGGLPELQQLLDVMPLQKIPNGPDEWSAFVAIHEGLRLEDEIEDRVKRVKIRWLCEIAKLGWVKTRDKYVALPEGLFALGDAFDFIDEVARAGVWLTKNVKQCHRRDNLSQGDLENLFWEKATNTWGMSRIVEASRIWHPLMIVRYDAYYERPADQCLQWEPLFKDPVWLTSGICAVALCQSTDLDKESSQLQHCVRSYESSCHQGYCHIVSLRNQAGASLSTVEIVNRDESNPPWRIAQHRGLKNQAPGESLLALEPLLLSHIQKTVDIAALKRWRDHVKEMATRVTPVKADLRAKFDLDRVRKLSDSLGSKRLMRLFVEESVLQAAERKFHDKKKQKIIHIA